MFACWFTPFGQPELDRNHFTKTRSCTPNQISLIVQRQYKLRVLLDRSNRGCTHRVNVLAHRFSNPLALIKLVHHWPLSKAQPCRYFVEFRSAIVKSDLGHCEISGAFSTYLANITSKFTARPFSGRPTPGAQAFALTRQEHSKRVAGVVRKWYSRRPGNSGNFGFNGTGGVRTSGYAVAGGKRVANKHPVGGGDFIC
jgi:hypothetical protein